MFIIQNAIAVVKQYWKTYASINVLYYGLTAACMIYVSANPAVQKMLMASALTSFTSGPLAFVGQAYSGGQVIWTSAVTFLVNLILGTAIEITLPSLIIPFSGLLMGILRAGLWGLMLAPTTKTMALAMIPHSLTLILEGQGYILALLAVVIQGKAFLFPKSEGTASHIEGYKIGFVKTAKLYVLVVGMLLVAAIYEAIEVMYVVPLLIK